MTGFRALATFRSRPVADISVVCEAQPQGIRTLNNFEFFWAFYGLLLGLAVAELLGAFAALLRESEPPRLGVVTPLLGLLILLEMLANYVDARSMFREVGVSLADFAVPTFIGLLYYVAAVIIVPRRLSEWVSLDDYFDKRRRWIVGTLLLANATVSAAIIPTAWLSHFSESGVWVAAYAVQVGSLLGAYTFLLLTRSRRLSVVAILFLMVWYFVFYGPLRIAETIVAAVG